ncbi:MAG: hypothetical protein N2053_10805, partial [Chitinispirillaceae bacterium]|nr:hypothetical protein [Chitinispirillaceae bacterium]
MKHRKLPLLSCIIILIFLCTKNENTTKTNPLITIPDTLPAITIPHKTPEPIITVGDGTEEGCTVDALEKAVDSLVKMKRGGTILFSTGGKSVTIPLRQTLKLSAPKESLIVIDGGNLITFDGQNKVRIIQCNHYTRLVLANIRLINGLIDSSGGAILHPWYGTLECYNVIFTNNRCTVRGPEFGGGAVFAGGLTKAIFVGCIFTYNSASNGGAILNRGSNLKIDSCFFQNNIATGDGGGKESGEKGQGGLGGAVYIDGMNYDLAEIFHLRKSTFIGNISHCHGSAVFSYYYKEHPGQQGAVIEMCSFLDNADSGTLTTSTGTLYHEGAPLKLHSSTFARNTTLKHAGAIFLGPDATTEIVNCTFYCNKTESNGGAIFGGKQNITIFNCTFYGNVGSYGPAIYNDVPEAVKVYNTIF